MSDSNRVIYRERAKKFKAMQWLGDLVAVAEFAPRYALKLEQYPGGQPTLLYEDDELAKDRCEFGNWLVKNESGKISIYTPSKFQDRFEPMFEPEEPVSLDSLWQKS